MFRKSLGILFIFLLFSCQQRDTVLDLPCEYFFNEFHIESTNISKYKSFTIFFNPVDAKSNEHLYFVSYDLLHFNLEINLKDSICLESYTRVRFFFKDGTVYDFFSENQKNCEGQISLHIKNITLVRGRIINKFQIIDKGKLITIIFDEKTQNKYEKMCNCFFDMAEKHSKKE